MNQVVSPKHPNSGRSLIVALDFADHASAIACAKQLDPSLVRVKVGKELFIAAGPAVVESLQQLGFDVFLDLKLFDIPNTVAKAVAAAAELGIWMLTLHALGGEEMLSAAQQAVAQRAVETRPLLIGVTVLTSFSAEQLTQTGIARPLPEQVAALAHLCDQVGLDGCVASAQEAPILRSQLSQDFALVTPGIRFVDQQSGDDQKRVCTPKQAMDHGSTYLVMGRPITQAACPQTAVQRVLSELTSDM